MSLLRRGAPNDPLLDTVGLDNGPDKVRCFLARCPEVDGVGHVVRHVCKEVLKLKPSWVIFLSHCVHSVLIFIRDRREQRRQIRIVSLADYSLLVSGQPAKVDVVAKDDLVVTRPHNIKLEQVTALGHSILECRQGVLCALLAASAVCAEDCKGAFTFAEKHTLVEPVPFLSTSAIRLQHAVS